MPKASNKFDLAVQFAHCKTFFRSDALCEISVKLCFLRAFFVFIFSFWIALVIITLSIPVTLNFNTFKVLSPKVFSGTDTSGRNRASLLAAVWDKQLASSYTFSSTKAISCRQAVSFSLQSFWNSCLKQFSFSFSSLSFFSCLMPASYVSWRNFHLLLISSLFF